ncbi:MAG: rhodanese-like domain-containing protein [Sumerlaeia bacterium]
MTATTAPTQTLSPQVTSERLKADAKARLIDVRTPAEFETEHATGALSIPLDTIDAEKLKAATPDGAPAYIICQSGARARKACDKLAAAGAENLVLVEGGTEAWKAAGLPTVKGRQTLPLIRQVHITVGSLILIGSALGFFVHVGFFAIPAFAGAGLLFAGLTGFCGMAMVLGKMPWNQAKS